MREFNPNDVPAPQGDFDFIKEIGTPIVLEIGAGTGDFAIDYALNNPRETIIAVEKTKEKFRKFKDKLSAQEKELSNLIPIHANAINFTAHYISAKSISKCFINYPNPYPKESQANKRFHRMPFFKFLKEAIVDGGTMELASNLLPTINEAKKFYLEEWSLKLIEENILEDESLAKTAFEKKYLSRGEKCYRLKFKVVH